MVLHAEHMGDATDSVYQFKPNRYSSHTLLLQNFPEHGRGRRVLDVGCADGYLSEILAERGFNVVGIEKQRQRSRPFPKSVQLIEADLDDSMPQLAGKFAFILCADILEHLRDPLKLLLELRALLEPEGRIVASLPNSGNAYFRLNVLLGRFPAQDRGLFDRTHLHFYTWAGWVDLLARGGFEIERVTPTAVPVGLAVPAWDGTRWVRALEALSYGLATVWKTMFAYQFIVEAAASRSEGA